MTKREYAISLGLAQPGRGRLSRAAHAAIAKAESEGMTFDVTESNPRMVTESNRQVVTESNQKTDKSKTDKSTLKSVDPKAVRKWANDNGLEIGARGRIHEDIISAYLDSGTTVETRKEHRGDGVGFFDDVPRTRRRDVYFGTLELEGDTKKIECRLCDRCNYSVGWCQCREGPLKRVEFYGPYREYFVPCTQED